MILTAVLSMSDYKRKPPNIYNQIKDVDSITTLIYAYHSDIEIPIIYVSLIHAINLFLVHNVLYQA